MSVDLSQFKGALTREVTPLGGALPSGLSATALTSYLTDAFWEARLDGFFVGYTVDTNGIVTNMNGGEDLDRKWVALIVLYAGIKILRNQILNTKTQFKAKAGPVEFEQAVSATMLAEMLKQLRESKAQILAEQDDLLGQTPTYYIDAFSTRVFDWPSYWGSPELTG